MVKAKKRDDGRWYGAIYMGKDIYGKKIYKHIYANSEKECNNKIIEFEYKKNNGLLEEEIKSNNLITLEDYWNDWLDNRIDISASTLREYKSIKKLYLTNLMKMKAKEINYAVIQHFYSDLYKKTNAKRVKKVSRLFNCFLRKMSVNRNCPIPRDVLDGLELPTTEKYIPKQIRELDYQSIMENLLKEYNDIKSNIQYLYILILVTSCSGCRIGESTALTINDIDFENNIITVNKKQNFINGIGYCIEEKTKTESGTRTIAILPGVKEKLEQHIKRQQQLIRSLQLFNFKPQNIVFIKKDNTRTTISSFDLLMTTNAGQLIKLNTAHRNWKMYKQKHNIDSNTRIHDFRRYFATTLMKNGIPDKLSKKMLGHSQIDMTQYYQNANDEIIQDYISNIDLKLK